MLEHAARIVHLHIPKTAGTALRSAFEKQYHGRLRCFPHYHEAKYAGINAADFDFYSGHFGYDTASKLDGQIITVFRHPVDRFVSVYYFWRQLYETGVERTINTTLAAKFSLDQFVQIHEQPGLLEEFHNRCTWQIAYGSSIDQRKRLRIEGQSDDAIFAMAVGNLAKIAVVGIQEDMRSFVASLKAKFNLDLAVQKINVTNIRAGVGDISVATRRAIQNWVYMDLELYQHVLRLQ